MLEILVNKEDIENLYVDKKNMDLSNYEELFPFSIDQFNTPKGKSILYLATWTYFSGHIDTQLAPRILHQNLSNHLEQLSNLSMTPLIKNKTLLLRGDNGILGRMIYNLGVTRRHKKDPLGSPLPKFMTTLRNTKHYQVIKDVFEMLSNKGYVVLDKYGEKEKAEEYAKTIGKYFEKEHQILEKTVYTTQNYKRCKIKVYHPKIKI